MQIARALGGMVFAARSAPGPCLALLVAALVLLAPPGALGERSQKGNLLVSLQGGVSPLKLPRDHPAPVALRIGGRIATTDGGPLPRLKQIRLTLGGRGRLTTTGLAVCPRSRIRNASNRQALRRCRPALVGRGALRARLFIPHQDPFPIGTGLLAFNGRTDAGRPAVWVHAYTGTPPVSIVLPFIIHRRATTLRTSLTAIVPPALGDLPHLAAFHLTLSRRFYHHGHLRSYLSASCPVPKAFNAGFLTFAKASYDFADGRTLRIEASRSCRAR